MAIPTNAKLASAIRTPAVKHIKTFGVKIETGDLVCFSGIPGSMRIRGQVNSSPIPDLRGQGRRKQELGFRRKGAIFPLIQRRGHAQFIARRFLGIASAPVWRKCGPESEWYRAFHRCLLRRYHFHCHVGLHPIMRGNTVKSAKNFTEMLLCTTPGEVWTEAAEQSAWRRNQRHARLGGRPEVE